MSGELDTLTDTVDRLLALDPDTLTDTELHDTVIALNTQGQRLGLARARLTRAWDRRLVWAGDGSASPAARLGRACRVSLSTARAEVRRGRLLDQMPELARRITAGRFTMDHVTLLSPCLRPWRAKYYREHEADLLDTIEGLDLDSAKRAIAYWCQRADADAEHTDKPPPPAEVHASKTLDDTVVITGTLDPISGAIVKDELDRLENAIRLADQANGVERTPGERRAAALVEMATRSRTAPANGRRPKPLFSVLLGDDSFRNLCEMAGVVLRPTDLLPWITEAMYETILFDGPSTIISVSNQRNFTGALRRAIEVRDRHCQHKAGCNVPAEKCDVDHIKPPDQGGRTSQFNGSLRCPPQNRHPDKVDHTTVLPPERPIGVLDEIRAKLRWRYRHYYGDGEDDGGDADTTAATA